MFGADFFLKVRLLLRKPVVQRLNLFERHGVLDSHGHLVDDVLEEFQIHFVVGSLPFGRKHQCAQSLPGSRQREPELALHPIFLHSFEQFRPSNQLGQTGCDQWPLGFPDQSRGVIFHLEHDEEGRFDALRGFQHVQVHCIRRRVVQYQRQGIELHDLCKSIRELMEQRREIAVRCNRVRHGKQHPVMVARGSCLMVQLSAEHGTVRQPITF